MRQTKMRTRFLAMLLAVMTVIQLIPVSALASEDAATDPQPVETVSTSVESTEVPENIPDDSGQTAGDITESLVPAESGTSQEPASGAENGSSPETDTSAAGSAAGTTAGTVEETGGTDFTANGTDIRTEEAESGVTVIEGEDADPEEVEEESEPGFEQETIFDGVRVTVKAEAGAFPADAMLTVEPLSDAQQEEAGRAVEKIRDGSLQVSASYRYLIRVRDANGNVLQPAGGNTAEVSFALPETADETLTPVVWRITGLADTETGIEPYAEELRAEVNRQEGTTRILTEKLSVFAVEFYGVTAAETEEDTKEPVADVEVRATSDTNNIIGTIFANHFNSANDELTKEAREASLAQYPLENHELAWYGDSPRVRYLESSDGDNPNYLVYRDSYVIIPQEESENYTISLSEDARTVFVTPAIDLASGVTGLIFLGANITEDDIFVFDGQPAYDDDTMTVSLRDANTIWINELFSDGNWVIENENSGGMRLMSNRKSLMANNSLMAGTSVDFDRTPSGTNWKGEITGFGVSWPTASVNINVWKLVFELDLHLKFSLDFSFETTGSSNGRETKKIAGISVPFELFNLDVDYNLQVNFDETPIKVKGTMNTDFEWTIDLLRGTRIKDYRTPVTIKSFELVNEERDCNKEVNFYIGSQLVIQGGFLSLKIKVWFVNISIGPLVSVNLDSRGGCYITAIHEKNRYDEPDYTADTIHTCAKNGEKGCQEFTVTEKNQSKIYLKLDLYFKSWNWNLTDSGENTVDTKLYYNSLTYGSGMQEGACPHRLYRVPVAVWGDREYTIPMADFTVNVTNEEPITEKLCITEGTTDKDGLCVLYLPYMYYDYIYYANGRMQLEGSGEWKDVVGSSSERLIREGDRKVNIVVNTGDEVRVKIRLHYQIDALEKDIPYREGVAVYRRLGQDGKWERIDSTRVDPTTINRYAIDRYDKYGTHDGKLVPYQYYCRIVDNPSFPEQSPAVPEERYDHDPYIVRIIDPDGNATGSTEGTHQTKYLVTNVDGMDEDGFVTNVTLTAVADVTLHKIWKLSDPENIAEAVYLGLSRKPEEGWENVAAQNGVSEEWTVVRDPIDGDTNSLKELKDNGLLHLSNDIRSIENARYAIAKVSEANGWSATWTVPKYQNGVKLRYRADELDTPLITGLFRYEYDLETDASIIPFGSYASKPGAVFRAAYADYTLAGNVINTDAQGHMISGTVRWESNFQWAIPDSVKVHIYKEGKEISGSPLTLNKSEYPDMTDWVWTLSGDDIDPDAAYTVTEEFSSEGDAAKWVVYIQDLDIYNHYKGYMEDTVYYEVRAVFDESIDQSKLGFDLIQTHLTSSDGSVSLNPVIYKNASGWYAFEPLGEKGKVKDIGDYRFTVDDPKSDIQLVKVIREPFIDYNENRIYYMYTVFFAPQENIKLEINKEWVNTDESTRYPDYVTVGIYRDDEKLWDAKLYEKDNWSMPIAVDPQGQLLYRTAEDGHAYRYTIRETPVDGFTSSVTSKDTALNTKTFTIKNTWVGSDYRTVKGTVTWEGDEGKETYRPENVFLSVVNSREEYVKSITVPVSGDGTFEAKYLPAKDNDGNELTYAVIENDLNYYTATYEKPSYDEKNRTWTCNVKNSLSGYFELTIKKEVQGKPTNDKESYIFTIEAREGENENTPEPQDKEVTIQGAGEAKARFFIEANGIHLYTVKEVKGSNADCEYDDIPCMRTERRSLIRFRKIL